MMENIGVIVLIETYTIQYTTTDYLNRIDPPHIVYQ